MRPIETVNPSEPRTNEIPDMSRRQVLIGGAIMAAGMSLPLATLSQSSSDSEITKGESMSHHLDSPIARQDVRLDISPISTYSAAKSAPYL